MCWDCAIQQFERLNEGLTATIQPGLHHTAMKWLFSGQRIPTIFSIFFPHTHHTTYSGMHWLLVTTRENERKVRSLRKRRKTCVTINRRESNPRPLDWKLLHIPLHPNMGHTHTHQLSIVYEKLPVAMHDVPMTYM